MRTRLITLLVAVALVLPVVAQAQWTQMDKQQEGAYADIQLDFLTPIGSSPALEGHLFVRGDLYGQLDFGAWGPYFEFSFTTDYPPGEFAESKTVSGNLEVGGFYQWTRRNWELFLRVGLTFPAASRLEDDVALNELGAFARVTDLVAHLPYDFTLRVSFSPEYRLGMFLMRFDLGFDVAVVDEGTTPLFFRGNAAFGIDLGMVSLAVESSNIGNLTSASIGDSFLHSVAFNVTFDTGGLEPYVGLSAPLAEGYRGELIAVTVGILFGSH